MSPPEKRSGPRPHESRQKFATDQSAAFAPDDASSGQASHAPQPHDRVVHDVDGVTAASGEFHAFRPCRDCGEPNVRPPVAYSVALNDVRRARDLSIAELARLADLSPSHVGRQLDPRTVKVRPSFTVARRLADVLELTGDARRLVLMSARAGVGLDLAVSL